MAGIPDGKHPLTTGDEMDSEETHDLTDVDIRATMSSDGKRVRLTVTDQDGEESRYELRGLELNGTPLRVKEPLTLYGVDVVIEWQAGGLGLYPGVNVLVTRPEADPGPV